MRFLLPYLPTLKAPYSCLFYVLFASTISNFYSVKAILRLCLITFEKVQNILKMAAATEDAMVPEKSNKRKTIDISEE